MATMKRNSANANPVRTMSEALRQIAPYMNLGWQLLATILVSLLIGWGIDSLLQTRPFGLILFAVLGIVAGLYSLFKTANRLTLK